jgi:hypothetical protein
MPTGLNFEKVACHKQQLLVFYFSMLFRGPSSDDYRDSALPLSIVCTAPRLS